MRTGRVLWLIPAQSIGEEAAREEQSDRDGEQEMMSISVSSQGGSHPSDTLCLLGSGASSRSCLQWVGHAMKSGGQIIPKTNSCSHTTCIHR